MDEILYKYVRNFILLKAKQIVCCLIIIGLLTGCGNDNVTDTTINHPPNIPSNPSPSTGAINVETNPQLIWQCSDPDNDSLTYDIYFGTWPDLSLSDSNLTQTTYSTGQLQEKVTYCWKIVAKDIYNDTTAGPKWHFSTYGNLPPDTPYEPYPESGATNQEIDIQLSWQCSDPEDDILTYDIYFGIDPDPPLYDSNKVSNYYSIGPLQYDTPFYWKVIAHDGHQHQTEGLIWNFSTRPEPDTVYFIGSYDTPGYAKAVFVSGNYAYVADGASGLQIIDVSNSSSPSFEGSCNTPGYAYDVFVESGYAYIADGDFGLQIIDVFDPSSPSIEGNYDTPGEAQGVFISGNYAYIADGTSGLHIINISNPENPSYAGSYDTPGESQDVFISGNYAYVADGYTGGLQIINVTHPSDPTYESSYNTPGTAWDIYISGIHVYVADLSEGLQILNIYEPASPDLVADYVTAGYAYDVFVSGDYIYVACHDAGLQILRFQ